MIEIVIKIFFNLIIAIITWLAIRKWGSDKSLPVLIIAAIVYVLCNYFVDTILGWLSDPKAKVSVMFNQNTIDVRMISEKPILLWDIDLLVFGEVIKINDFVESGDAKVSKCLNHKSYLFVNGRESHPSFIQFHIENAISKKELRYTLEIKPMDKDITYIGGTETYKVSYQWIFNGNIRNKTNWFSTKTGKIVKKPAVRQGLYKVYN